jgi:uncharacterized repeat protein (TIGR01451 family)
MTTQPLRCIRQFSEHLTRGRGRVRTGSRALRYRRPALEFAGSRAFLSIEPPRAVRLIIPAVTRLEVRALLSISVLQNFPDINFNQTSCNCTPPDTMMAVGPTTVLGAVNTALVLKSNTGSTIAGPEEFGTFFSSIHQGSDGFSDPYVNYDDQANRYYVGIIEYPSSATTGFYDFAVSNSSSPTGLTIGTGPGQWTVFSQITSVNEGGTEFPDFPKMGWNADAVFVSFNQFAGGAFFDHNLVLAISKASILSGGPLSTFQTDVATGSDTAILIPARMHGSSSGTEYFAQKGSEGTPSGTVNVVAESGYLTKSPSFTTTTITVNGYSDSPGVPGLTSQIDDRMLSADWVNNLLAASMDVGVGGLNLARWYEFSTSGTPALLSGQEGDISAGSGVSTSYPSVAINSNGDIAMSFIQSSASQPYSMYVTGRLAADSPGTMQTPVEIAAGVLPVPFAYRGGDYSATEYDPSNNSQFWSANEYNFDSSGSNGDWGTQIAEYTLGPPPPPADLAVTNPNPPQANEGDTLTYTVTVTNGGPNDAPNTVLTDTLGTNLKYVSASSTLGTVTQSGGVVTVNVADLANGGSFTLTLMAQATEDGNLSATASVTSSAHDPNPGDNTVTASTKVIELLPVVSGPITVTSKKVNNFAVATFTHANGIEPASAFIATINWGDGKTSTGTITESSTTFTYTVTGSHNYTGKGGSHTVTTTVTESGSTPNVAIGNNATAGGGNGAADSNLGAPVQVSRPSGSSSPASSAAIVAGANEKSSGATAFSDRYLSEEAAVLSAALATTPKLKSAIPQGPRALGGLWGS